MSDYCFTTKQVWDIEMKGFFGLVTRHWLKGNQKVMTTNKQGENTKFQGHFYADWNSFKNRWELIYGCFPMHNKWYIRRIHDTVKFLSAEETDGKFYWWIFRLSKFTMKLSVSLESVEAAFDNLFEKTLTFVDRRQMLSLNGTDFSDERWEEIEGHVYELLAECYNAR